MEFDRLAGNIDRNRQRPRETRYWPSPTVTPSSFLIW